MSEHTYVTVRVAGSQFGYNGETYAQGDELEVHEGALEKHPRTLERVETEPAIEAETADDLDGDDEGDADENDVQDLDPHPSELTVPEIEERVSEVDDVELLEAIREAEVDGKDRTTATDAIDSRLDELEE